MTDHVSYQGTDDYIVSNDLRNSVNISVALKRPLLIKGSLAPVKPSWRKALPALLDSDYLSGILNPPPKHRMAFMFMTRSNACMTVNLASRMFPT